MFFAFLLKIIVYFRSYLLTSHNSALVAFAEARRFAIFFEVDEDDIIKTFMSLQKRRIKEPEKSILSLWYSFMPIF
jgi:hypothetical protein